MRGHHPRRLGAWLQRSRLIVVLIGVIITFSPLAVPIGHSESPRFAPETWPSHDWRSPGFVSIVGGQMYDPDCWPMQSIGANVPNLMYREATVENLHWMKKQSVRWIRVFVTGHREERTIAADRAEQRLRELTHLVESYNATVGRDEAIYLLITLTDYYGQGVPGDVYVRDNPNGCEFVVLPAPWYRRGTRSFSFEQECGAGLVTDAPNYEVNYKPWVQRLVASVADSPAILGWQLGNELKARNNVRNGIEDAYDWYLDFVRDMVDTIRSIDRNHPIFLGAQYFAELTDIPYRPASGGIDPYLRDKYLEAVDEMARACGAYCWNVWNLTYYDFNQYAIDDAMLLGKGKVASVATEYGFTLGTPAENQTRFGGDRVAALRSGLARPWQDIDGQWRQAHWSLADSIRELRLVGAAAWGSPNPDPETDPGSDLDRRRGISHAPEGMALWQQWSYVAQELEFTNGRSGASAACLEQKNSSGRAGPAAAGGRQVAAPSILARPAASPTPPLNLVGTVAGIRTDSEPALLLQTSTGEMLVKFPRGQDPKTFNIGDTVRARGWPIGDGVMQATSLEHVRGAR